MKNKQLIVLELKIFRFPWNSIVNYWGTAYSCNDWCVPMVPMVYHQLKTPTGPTYTVTGRREIPLKMTIEMVIFHVFLYVYQRVRTGHLLAKAEIMSWLTITQTSHDPAQHLLNPLRQSLTPLPSFEQA